MDDAARAHRHEVAASADGVLDDVETVRHLAEPHHVGPQARGPAAAARDEGPGVDVLPIDHRTPAALAAQAEQFAVHVERP